MPHPSESPPTALSSSPLSWDGKCQTCRKLMSRCTCFQESEGDAHPLHAATSQATPDAAETRPLWNALRKMHRTSTGARLSLLQPSEQHRKRSEALPPLSAPTRASTSSSRPHLHRRSDARAPRRSSREQRREPSPERPSTSRKDRLQRAGFTNSSHNLKRDAAKETSAMRSVRSASSLDKDKYISASRSKERFSYEPEEEDEETVWEL
ncbi:hypothetical protein PF005_g12588 [Phytophthora fragariae]|uniref:Uncharacterized protein n=1 Tax=Phytophthora fragariae TaxID=53985 RepID=A0A6A3EX41_9STRA|nr:hypothetical protein PF003_g37145 [Phytophthora fragariae]KAE8936936.1 hypothetical protein PF009_g13152 [Phytophthora fragariae]KAE9001122.1 hypothetical protein PF011_g13888 [Phytophthora fragariae]KAE9101599.1 hypothetical protein PF010_g14396 [Phytophthora fragariae]KAE9115475.1 hypothetical protein PF007_g10013 [Phytophthora fragariae]